MHTSDGISENRINKERLHTLFKEMVDIYSPSGKEDVLTSFLVEFLEGRDMNVLLRPVDEQRFNIEVSARQAVPDTLFLGHIDTVPAFDIEEYSFSEEKELCRGLGTADMKGGCAAMIEAFISASEGGFLPENVLLSLVAGEEESGDGTKTLLDAYQFKHALVAEPTSLIPCTSHYGYIELLLNVYGYRRHAAMSDYSSHTIRSMLRLLLQLDDHILKHEADTVLNIRDLHSSESGFAVPDRCSAAVDIHLPPDRDAANYADALNTFLKEYLDKSAANTYDIEMPFISGGYAIPRNDPFTAVLQKVFSASSLEWSPGSFKSHSDANLLRDTGCTPIILGPGSLAAAHTRDEFVDFTELVSASALYTELLRSLQQK